MAQISNTSSYTLTFENRKKRSTDEVILNAQFSVEKLFDKKDVNIILVFRKAAYMIFISVKMCKLINLRF